jgi:hypothetical protein
MPKLQSAASRGAAQTSFAWRLWFPSPPGWFQRFLDPDAEFKYKLQLTAWRERQQAFERAAKRYEQELET